MIGGKKWNTEIDLYEGKKTMSYRSVIEGLPFEDKVHLEDIIILTKN